MVKIARKRVNVSIKTPYQLDRLRMAAAISMEILSRIAEQVSPGMTAADVDELAVKYCAECGVRPAFLGYGGFPGAICVSVNEEVVHGLPLKTKVFREGDIVSLDFGVVYEGYYGDVALTVPVGKVSPGAIRLIEVTRDSLYEGISKIAPGEELREVAFAINDYVSMHGYSVVRDYAGHGIGERLHEEPQITNYVHDAFPEVIMQPGMVFAIEPMVNEGTYRVLVKDDSWTVVTEDGKLSAHFEHDVAVSENGYIILSQI